MNNYNLREVDGIGFIVKKNSKLAEIGECVLFVIAIVSFGAFMLYIALPAFK